jgi:hypothetical protein
MEDFLREILVPSPTLPSSVLPPCTDSADPLSQTSTLPPLVDVGVDWDSEVEMQRLLDMLPNVQSTDPKNDISMVDFPLALDFDDTNGGWATDHGFLSSLSVGVF